MKFPFLAETSSNLRRKLFSKFFYFIKKMIILNKVCLKKNLTAFLFKKDKNP